MTRLLVKSLIIVVCQIYILDEVQSAVITQGIQHSRALQILWLLQGIHLLCDLRNIYDRSSLCLSPLDLFLFQRRGLSLLVSCLKGKLYVHFVYWNTNWGERSCLLFLIHHVALSLLHWLDNPKNFLRRGILRGYRSRLLCRFWRSHALVEEVNVRGGWILGLCFINLVGAFGALHVFLDVLRTDTAWLAVVTFP